MTPPYLIEPLPTPPVDGVPIAAVQHVIHDTRLTHTAVGVFMYCASYAWELAPPRTYSQLVEHWRQRRDETRAAVDELVEAGLLTHDPLDDTVHCTTGVPGGEQP